ncbi:GTPase CgtA [Paucilactobacillus hokkaidonensis JCM 18461]|uniref:GTPase Obg n=2 Tax=Paucilactobacillus hokkaidonensis TaxID=1193095 RepID=A0A0A1GUA0_9LACO|nr:GTPase ObgE [Paucilactobacillus hokkaidonensis]KRO08907.1 GTPase CgtA [Paucilactobacillus hokkaidonensis]BAP85852.1 GTPase CgtA [Paucilactobacillus hokkaidonensis JCM 18461]
MFVDQIKIQVHAGKGGDGMVAFRREKYVPNGGPAGGDGGRGGSIILRVDEGLRTLMDFRYHRIFKADNGGKGMIKQMTGRGAQDTIISVPQGTTVKETETGYVLGDLVEQGDELVVAKGGRGGRGNIHFATPRNPAPEMAENGEPGQTMDIELELKMLADVGLVGFPSVGKSTLLSVVTGAKPKIAEYEFTTLVPNLGMVKLDDGRDFAMADLPGLIAGASKGVGLGLQFLRHIERTRVLLHVVDMSSEDENQAITRFDAINHELESYDPELLKRPQVLVATKMDLPNAADNLDKFKEQLQQDKTLAEVPEIYPISAITHQGLTPLLQYTAKLLDETPAFLMNDDVPVDETSVYKFEDDKPAFEINQDEYGVWILTGDKLLRLFEMTDMLHEESQMRFARQLRGMGVDDALREKGAKSGDTVQIEKFTFDFVE